MKLCHDRFGPATSRTYELINLSGCLTPTTLTKKSDTLVTRMCVLRLDFLPNTSMIPFCHLGVVIRVYGLGSYLMGIRVVYTYIQTRLYGMI